jgi:membrane associated rhomboid family serine protease
MAEERRADANEPVLTAPWPPLALSGLLVALFAVQGGWPLAQLALVPAHLSAAGGWTGLLTSLFVHGGWAHVLMNAAFLLAFGTPLARAFGTHAGGALAFLLFYLLCGVLGGLGYVLLHPDSGAAVVGASGAVSGLLGATARLMAPPGRLAPFLSPPVLGITAATLIVNLLAAVLGTLPGAGGAGVAWEAHLAGYAAGLLLIGPAAALAWRMPR